MLLLLPGAVLAQQRDWIESRLPQAAISADQLRALEAALQAELKSAGLGTEIKFRMLPELSDSLFVIAGAAVECGFDQTVYLYHFDAHGRTRVFEDHPGGRLQFMYAELELSGPDAKRRRLLAVHYMSAQCASTWMVMAHSVYRLRPARCIR